MLRFPLGSNSEVDMYNYERDPNDEDEQFYEDTVYNEHAYIEEENEKIR